MSGSLPAFLARRLALLALTLVLVPSLSFVMFTLIQGDHTAPLDVLRELGSYLSAIVLQGDVGEGTFRNQTFIRTQGALDVVMEGFVVDLYLLVGGIGFAVLAGLAAGTYQARHPRSPAVARDHGPHRAGPRLARVLRRAHAAAPVRAGLGRGGGDPVPLGHRGLPVAADRPVAFVHHLWMPCVILGAPLAAACTRMTASQLAGIAARGLRAHRAREGRARAARRAAATRSPPRRRRSSR